MNRLEKYDTQTEGSRIDGWYRILDQQLIKERVFASTPRITSVGIGVDAGFVMDPWYRQSYEPYVLAGWAHGISSDFQLTLVDASINAIQSVRDGKLIYLDKISLDRNAKMRTAWLRLQSELGSSAESITTNDGTLELIQPFDSSTDTSYMFSQGMERIAIPHWFTDKVSVGDISFVNQDIRDVVEHGNQSLIFCLNVLLHYPQDQQAVILERMSQMLDTGKLLVLNEGMPSKDSLAVTQFRKTLFTENGGWLTKQSLKTDFHFNIANKIDDKRIYTLEKV